MPKDEENKRMIFISGKFLSETATKIIFTDFYFSLSLNKYLNRSKQKI